MYNGEMLGEWLDGGGAIAVIDTGTSLIGVPDKYFEYLVLRW